MAERLRPTTIKIGIAKARNAAPTMSQTEFASFLTRFPYLILNQRLYLGLSQLPNGNFHFTLGL